MGWRRFLVTLVRNALLIVVLAAAILGGIGFLVNGTEGLINGAGWGLVISVVSIPFTAGLIWVRYMEDSSVDYGEDWYRKQMDGER